MSEFIGFGIFFVTIIRDNFIGVLYKGNKF